MYVIRTENSNTNNRALVVPPKEWRRLKNLITKQNEDITVENEIKKLKNERQVISKAIIESWPTTVVNIRRREKERKQKLLADREATIEKNYEEYLLKITKRRNEILEKVRAKKWSEKDSIKLTTRAMHKIEIFREREMQIKFNEAERMRIMEEERLLKIRQNLEAEQYKKEQWKKTLKHAEIKKTNADHILKELKEREDIRHNLNLQLQQEGKAEFQKISREFEEEVKEKKAKIIADKEKILKYEKENREYVAKKNKLHKLNEQEENMAVSIMDETKKKISKIRKYKEIQLLKEKQLMSEKIAEKIFNNQVEKINTVDQGYEKAIKEQEHKYIQDEHKKKELEEKRKKDMKDLKKFFDEENRKEKERLALSTEWELERRIQDTKMLTNLRELNCRRKIDEMNRFREQLDVQCNNNIITNMADKQEELKQYDILKKSWLLNDQEFMTNINKLINNYKKAGISIVPLLKTIKDYEKNKLL